MHLAKSLFPLTAFAMASAFFFACGDDSPTQGKTDDPNPESSAANEEFDPDTVTWNFEEEYSWKGSGSETSPYEIASAEDLEELSKQVNDYAQTFKGKFFKLTKDVKLSETWKPIGMTMGGSAVGLTRPFKGSFDGNDKTISGLELDMADSVKQVGLFGLVLEGSLKNINLKATVKAPKANYVGLLVGQADNSEILNCTLSGSLEGNDYVGGVAGAMTGTTVTNVVVDGSVTGNGNVGGLIGTAVSSTITDSDNKAVVKGSAVVAGIVGNASMNSAISKTVNSASVTGTKDVAGIAAMATSVKIEQCGNKAAIVGGESALSSVAGIAAVTSQGTVLTEVFNQGEISGEGSYAAAGIVANFKQSDLSKAYNVGAINGAGNSYLAGVVGFADAGSGASIKIAYNAGPVPALKNTGAIIGFSKSGVTKENFYFDKDVADVTNTSFEAVGMTTADMSGEAFASTLNELDASNQVWTSTGSYPVFTWFNKRELR